MMCMLCHYPKPVKEALLIDVCASWQFLWRSPVCFRQRFPGCEPRTRSRPLLSGSGRMLSVQLGGPSTIEALKVIPFDGWTARPRIPYLQS